MYPQTNTNVDYGLLTNDMTDDNKRLCRDLCKVGLCLTCFCSAYLILFLGVIDSELDMDIMNMTYF
jgi:hypothetical protein